MDPNAPGHYPPCPFLAVTGLWCPGCGSLRALHALLHLDVGTALARNPFAVLASIYIAWTFYRWAYRRVTGTPLRLAPGWVITVVWVSIVAFWISTRSLLASASISLTASPARAWLTSRPGSRRCLPPSTQRPPCGPLPASP